MTKDMTTGNPLKLILWFALPLLIGNLLQQTYNVIDAAIVGRYLGTQALAGVGASSSVQFMVMGFCIGSCNGFAIPVARDFGAGDYGRMRKVLYHAIMLTIVLAVFLTGGCLIFCSHIIHLLSTPADIYDNAYIYLVILFAGIPFTFLYNLLSSMLRAVGDSKTPFYFLAIAACSNVVLDLIFIIVFKLGCAGAALATITGQGLSGILCLLYMRNHFEILHLRAEDRHFDIQFVGELLMLGIPMGLQFSITAIGSMVMQAANNGLGSIYVSAFTAASRIKQFAMCPFDAVATGVSVFCSQNLGARKTKRIYQGLRQGVSVTVTYGAVIGLVLIFLGRNLSMLFITADETAVLDAAAKYLRCMGYFYWTLGILNVLRMCTQGLGYSTRAIFSGVTEMIARIFVSFTFVGTYGYTAICFADQSAWVSATLYIVPTCLLILRKLSRNIENENALAGEKT